MQNQINSFTQSIEKELKILKKNNCSVNNKPNVGFNLNVGSRNLHNNNGDINFRPNMSVINGNAQFQNMPVQINNIETMQNLQINVNNNRLMETNAKANNHDSLAIKSPSQFPERYQQ